MKKQLIGKVTQDGAEDMKYLFFNGQIKVKCPDCRKEMIRDFESDHIEYPQIGKSDVIGFECEGCEKEYEMSFKVKSITVELEYNDKLVKQ